MTLLGPYVVGCALLAAAGIGKVFRPQATARALTEMAGWTRSLRRVSVAVRAGALVEATLGVYGIVAPTRLPAVLVVISYSSFAGFVLYARHSGARLSSCGCFSALDTPPTVLHVILDIGFAISAATLAIRGPSSTISSFLIHQPLHGVPFVVTCGIGAWLSYLAIVALPRLALLRPGSVVHSEGRAESMDDQR